MGGMNGLAALARSQHGLISLEQIRTELGDEQKARWLRDSGNFDRIHRGVYCFRGVPPSWEQKALAALMVAGPASALSHQTAGALLKLDAMPLSGPIELTVPDGRHLTTPGILFHRTREALPFRRVRGLRVTSLARTMVDLASILPPPQLEFALDCAQRQNPGLLGWIDTYVTNLSQPRRPGLGTLMEFVGLRRDGAMDSCLEVRVWRALRKHGFPQFVKRYVVKDQNGQYVIRLDFAWPALKVALHVDGYRYHHHHQQMVRDAEQRSRLAALGWHSVIVMAETLKDDRWLENLRHTLAQRVK